MKNGLLFLAQSFRENLSETVEALEAARPIADELRVPLYALLIAEEPQALAHELGAADAVLWLQAPAANLLSTDWVAEALHGAMSQKEAGLILLTATNLAMGIASLLAARAQVPLINFCKQLRVDRGQIVATCQYLGGKMLAQMRLPDHRGIIVLEPGAANSASKRPARDPVIEPLPLSLASPRVRLRRMIPPAPGDVDITKQEILVAIGRGFGRREDLDLADQLVQALHGALCASRPIVDQGWLPITRQVGKSGMTVRPRCYLALGVSGAPEHIEGMKDAQLIIAVNTDPYAPIFEVSHYGVVGDVLELVPILLEKIRNRQT